MFHEMNLKQYFMKCLERKISQCIIPSIRAELDDAMETTSKLSLFTDDVDFVLLLPKLSKKITQNILQIIQHSSIYNYFKQYTVIRMKTVA